ncbi:hypothetical protein [Rhodoplanes azumiensis]|uniref:Uncharacterized protein n=1 Tax=Rhodoplanes azumiensis TaxID=1897628 RepID=A0ABW5AP72_9BRAD
MFDDTAYDNAIYDRTGGSAHLLGFDRGDWLLLVSGCVLSTVLTFLV